MEKITWYKKTKTKQNKTNQNKPKTKPNQTQTKPNQTKPNPNQTKPNQTKPNQIKPKPNQTKPKPNQIKPNCTESLFHFEVSLSFAARSNGGHAMRLEQLKNWRLIFIFLFSFALLVLLDKLWRRIPQPRPAAKPQPHLGCLYTVEPPSDAQAWQLVSFTVRPNNDVSCIDSTIALRSGGSTFRVQAFGSREMVTGNIVHIANDTYKGMLRLTFQDEYIVMVILTYVNNASLEYRSHSMPVLQHVHASPFDLKVSEGPSPVDYTRYCSQQESGTAPGRWVECGSLPGVERCSQWQLDPVYDFDQIHGFHWVPYFCQLHHYTNDEIKKCFAKNSWSSIVFTGDSHMRYRTYHWVTRLHGSCHGCIKTHVKMVFNKIPRIEWMFDARGTRWPLTFPSISLPNEIYVNPRTRRSMFSKELPPSVFRGKLYLINFGHWVLRESTRLGYMHSKLSAYVQAIKAMNNTDSNKRFLWVNTVSLPWRADRAVVEWLENPSPSRVAQWNQLSDEMMRQGGVQIVDAFQISNSRIGATHDQTHFAKRLERGDCGGVVENAISNVIANALCNYDI